MSWTMTDTREDVFSWDHEVPETICRIPEFGLYCFGCCGYDWKPIDNLRRQINYNTWRYTKFCTRKSVFAGTTDGVTKAGVCKAVITLDDGSLGCPLHPTQNHGEDLRKGDCLRNYECNTLKHYMRLKERDKRAFLEFLGRKDFNSYQYSMANAKGTLLTIFKKRKGLSRFSIKGLFK